MPSYRRASVRELANHAYELEAGVLQGSLRRGAGGEWLVGDVLLEQALARYTGQHVVLIVASLDDDRPMDRRTCRTCGTEYIGVECPHCREARIRLRGR